MPSRRQTALVLFLCVLATGIQWDMLQAFAWGRMVANYARTEPVAAAVAHTFNGQMCQLCRMVAAAEKPERAAPQIPSGKLEAKVLLFFQPAPSFVVTAPGALAWIPAPGRATTQERAVPPVPPPRTLSA